LLEGWGLQVIRAASGEELLAKLTVVPDILITDYWLGQGSGLDVAHNLRERYPGTEFRIVIVTGDTSEHGKRVLNESGYPFLLKPVRPAKLRALTAHLLRSVNDQPQTYDH
jgi:CheY-like chemotaxis protein